MPFLSSSVISALNIIRGGGAAGEAGTLLLDLYPNASAAYSLRKLKTAYEGAAIEVRVDTTGQPTYDIGFDSNGDLDAADLLSKAGANDAYVKTWYDQSGNGNDATQTTSTYQPIIVSSGVIETYLSKPCLSISNDFLQTASYQQTSSGDLSSFLAGSFNGNGVVVGNDTGTRIWRHRAVPSLSKFQAQKIAGGVVTDDVLYSSDTPLLSTAIFNSSKIEVFNNSTTDGSEASTSLETTNGNLGLFARSVGSDAVAGSVFEIIVYSSDQSSNQTNIENNINEYYNIYWNGSQTGLLDTYPASVAYSVRALNSAYTGPLVKVRRSSDNDEQDIYALYDGSLDTEGLESFCAATDGFVTTWYDQSGNANNATNSTDDEQPIIVSSGTIETSSSLPTVNFTNVSSNDGLEMTSRVSMGACFIAYNINDLNAINYGVGDDTTLGGVNSGLLLGGTFSGVNGLTSFNSTFLDLNNAETTGTTQLAVYDYSAGDVYLSNNGTALSNEGAQTQLSVKMLGARRPNFSSADSKISEVIIYSSSQSSNFGGITSNINTHYNIYWDGSQTGLLDDYPGASAAYSLIALNSAYIEPLVKVRRSSDNDEQDIYANYDGTLDTEGLLSFVGAGDGFITVWYDQSGSAKNITQSAAADQPQIVSSGSLITDGDGIIAPSYDGINDDMLLPGTPFAFNTDSVSLFMVAKALGNDQNAFNLAGTNDYFAATYGRSTPGQLVVGYYEDGGLVSESIEGTAGVDKHLLSAIFTRGTTSLAGWINGSAMTNPATGLLRANFNTNVIGSRGGAYELNGTIQLMVIYDSDQTANRSDIETIINNYYSIYP